MSDTELNLINVYRLAMRNWKLIATVCLINVIVASVILLIVPNSYKSSSLFFPTSDLISDKSSQLNEFTPLIAATFGRENLVDRIFSVATSQTVKNHVIESLNLREHYGYENTQKGPQKTGKRFDKNVKIRRTPYNGIEIVSKDYDHEIAAQINQSILDKTESIYHDFLLKTRAEIAKGIEKHISQKDSVVQEWSKELAALRSQYGFYGIISPNREQATIPSTGGITGEGFEKIQNLEQQKEKLITDISQLRTLQGQILLTAAPENYMLLVVDAPYPSMVKAGPKRTLTVLLVALASFFFMLIFLILRQQLNNETIRR